MSMELISCDWGTSSLRLSLVATCGGGHDASVSGEEGAAVVHGKWTDAGRDRTQRERFYIDVLETQIAHLGDAAGRDLHRLPVIVSGMASSSIGLREIPHQPMPFAIDGSDLHVERIEAAERPVWLVSGARTTGDMMRGEEVQVVGAIALGAGRDALQVLPGTHSKHVTLEGDQAVGLRTYMTGEFFELLSRKSILKNSLEPDGQVDTALAESAFTDGVACGAQNPLLHASFGVRVAELSGRRSRAESHHYLSGLLIGSELRDVARTNGNIVLVAGDTLTSLYGMALRSLNHQGRVQVVPGMKAVTSGHLQIARKLDLFV